MAEDNASDGAGERRDETLRTNDLSQLNFLSDREKEGAAGAVSAAEEAARMAKAQSAVEFANQHLDAVTSFGEQMGLAAEEVGSQYGHPYLSRIDELGAIASQGIEQLEGLRDIASRHQSNFDMIASSPPPTDLARYRDDREDKFRGELITVLKAQKDQTNEMKQLQAKVAASQGQLVRMQQEDQGRAKINMVAAVVGGLAGTVAAIASVWSLVSFLSVSGGQSEMDAPVQVEPQTTQANPPVSQKNATTSESPAQPQPAPTVPHAPVGNAPSSSDQHEP